MGHLRALQAVMAELPDTGTMLFMQLAVAVQRLVPVTQGLVKMAVTLLQALGIAVVGVAMRQAHTQVVLAEEPQVILALVEMLALLAAFPVLREQVVVVAARLNKKAL